MTLGKNITWKKGKGKQYNLPMILRLLGRISSGERDGNFGEECQDFKTWGWEEYQFAGNSIQPCKITGQFLTRPSRTGGKRNRDRSEPGKGGRNRTESRNKRDRSGSPADRKKKGGRGQEDLLSTVSR